MNWLAPRKPLSRSMVFHYAATFCIYLRHSISTLKTTMQIYYLSCSVVNPPDFGGFYFFVKSGGNFDAQEYAEVYGIDPVDIDESTIGAVRNWVKRLGENEWLAISHQSHQ